MSAIRAFALLAALAASSVSAPPAAAQTLSRIRLTAPAGESLLVHGDYPPVQSSCVDPYQPLLHARYRGTIDIERASDGSLRLIGELSFEDYIRGIAEVPRDWPMAALKAQVVAARTYALNRYEFGETSGDWDLCATTECQVYVGMKVEAGPWGDRWMRAVQETAGQVLLYQGKPAITYYSSTSPGRTFDVEDRFGGEPLPYLRGVEEPDDGASPLAHWRVELPFDDLDRFLSAEGLWAGGAVSRVAAGRGGIRITGGDTVTLSKDALRDALNDSASCLAPDRYPTSEPDGYRLPQTVPSVWYRASQEGASLVLAGRGWGHGVGMVQWGAYGKARRGLPYDDILAAYYGGLRPQAVDLPGTIRILIAEGLSRISVAPSSSAEVQPALGPEPPWIVRDGRRLRVRHGPPPRPVLEATGFASRRRAALGEPVRAALTLSDDASVRLEFLRSGEIAGATAWGPHEEGDARVAATVPGLAPGRYEVRAAATDGVDTVLTDARPVTIEGAASPSPSPSPSPAPTRTATARAPSTVDPAGAAAGGLVSLLAFLAVLTAGRRKGLHRS
jgi:SpoIID/LytB domain protein